MKPRLPSAPFTDEDQAAWFDWQVNRGRDWRLWGALEKSFESDRRDADLMLAWTQGWPIDLGGNDEEGECLFWGDPP